jgi:hypothetical protein
MYYYIIRKKRGKMRFFLLAISLFTSTVLCAPAWHSQGLDNHNVRSLLVINDTRIIAGTDSGLYIFWGSGWIKIDNSTLPANALVKTDDGAILAACGNGSRSDGIYLGQDMLDGPPFYVFSLVDWAMWPTALGLKGQDTLYVGAPNRIYRSVRRSLSFDWSNLVEIKTPPWCFGVESPRCAAVHAFRGAGTVYAGGYDQSPMPGPGNLIYVEGDTSRKLLQYNVSALASGTFYEVGPSELVFGTTDDGLYRYNPVTRGLTHIPSPNSEPVRHVITAASMLWSDFLYVAVQGGVYQGGSFGSTTLSPVGVFPGVVPNCLAHIAFGDLYAGTSGGVYRYGEAAAVGKRSMPSSRALVVPMGPAAGVLTMRIAGVIDGARMVLCDINGRVAASQHVRNGKVRISGLGAGAYFYKIMDNGECAARGRAVVY